MLAYQQYGRRHDADRITDRKAYASADLFVFPSDTETFGQVIQEAMASGLPVLAAGAGGVLDLVQPGLTGALFTPGSVTELQQKARLLLDDDMYRLSMGVVGRAAAEQCSWERVMQQLLDHYQTAHRYRRLLRACLKSILAQAPTLNYSFFGILGAASPPLGYQKESSWRDFVPPNHPFQTVS